MDAAALLADLRGRGLAVGAEGDALIVKPRSGLTDANRRAIREHKAELLALLDRPDPDDVARFLAWGMDYCWPELSAAGVEVSWGEASWRAFAQRCAAWELAAVLPLCWWYPEIAEGETVLRRAVLGQVGGQLS